MNHVEIKSDGTRDNTTVIVNGEPMTNVLSVTWHLDANDSKDATVTLVLSADIDVELKGENWE